MVDDKNYSVNLEMKMTEIMKAGRSGNDLA